MPHYGKMYSNLIGIQSIVLRDCYLWNRHRIISSIRPMSAPTHHSACIDVNNPLNLSIRMKKKNHSEFQSPGSLSSHLLKYPSWPVIQYRKIILSGWFFLQYPGNIFSNNLVVGFKNLVPSESLLRSFEGMITLEHAFFFNLHSCIHFFFLHTHTHVLLLL